MKFAEGVREAGGRRKRRKTGRRVRRERLFCGILAVSLAVFLIQPLPAAATEETQAALEAAQEAVSQTEDAIETNQETLDTLDETKSSLSSQLDSLSTQLNTISSNLAVLREQISEKEEEIEDLQARIEETEILLQQMNEALEEAQEAQEAQYASMKRRIQFLYEKGSAYYLEILLSSRSFGEFLNYRTYIEDLSAYDAELLEEYTALAEEIADQKAQLEEEQDRLEEEQAQLTSQQSQLQDLQDDASSQAAEVESLVSQTADSISVADAQISTAEEIAEILEDQLEAQNAEVSALQEQLAEEQRLQELSDASVWRDISQITFEEGDRSLLANLIYCEAGGESYEGQLAVGAVVMNRVMSGAFPDTISGVIYQSGQFSPVSSGRLAIALANDSATDSCYQAADAAMAGETNVSDCLFFRTPIDEVTPQYTIGGHIFY